MKQVKVEGAMTKEQQQAMHGKGRFLGEHYSHGPPPAATEAREEMMLEDDRREREGKGNPPRTRGVVA